MSRVLSILFNTEMVRAILDGRKTCTRRIIKPPEGMDGIPVGESGDSNSPLGFMYPGGIKRPPYEPGNILYVREAWCDDRQFTHDSTPGRYFYKASESGNFKWKPSIHMPKEAARIWLKVTDVRVERLQEITSQGAWKEGARCSCLYPAPDCAGNKTAFIDIWNSTIKKSDLNRYGWYTNPWVWVIEFERCEKPEGA